jgi:hypothetical protein
LPAGQSNIEKFIDFAIVLVWFRLIRVGVLVVDFSSGSFIFLLSNPDKPELKIEYSIDTKSANPDCCDTRVLAGLERSTR